MLLIWTGAESGARGVSTEAEMDCGEREPRLEARVAAESWKSRYLCAKEAGADEESAVGVLL